MLRLTRRHTRKLNYTELLLLPIVLSGMEKAVKGLSKWGGNRPLHTLLVEIRNPIWSAISIKYKFICFEFQEFYFCYVLTAHTQDELCTWFFVTALLLIAQGGESWDPP